MLLTFAGLSLVCTQLPAQQSAALTLNMPVGAKIEKLRGSDSAARWSAVNALPDIPDPRFVPALVEALKDSDANVRGVAAYALDAISGPDAKAAAPTRVEALKDSNVRVRQLEAEVEALGATGPVGWSGRIRDGEAP